MSGDDDSDTTVSDYLERKGAIELLCEIEPNGSQFSQLVGGVEITRNTVSSRLQEGEELGLIEKQDIQGRGTDHAYRLTQAGAKLRLYLDHTGITEQYRIIKQLRRDFNERAGELIRWAEENETELEPPVEEDTHLQHFRKYDDLDID